MASRQSVPRGRHAPPLAVRQDRQRERLFQAAAAVFSRVGYADATAEAIAREAGMSKATFYEHFTNKEECMLALFQMAADATVGAMAASQEVAPADPLVRLRASINAFFSMLENHPDYARTLLVEIIGAGPEATRRRDQVLVLFAQTIYANNQRRAEQFGIPSFQTEHDAFAIVGAITELASRQLRLGIPENIHDLEPVVERLILGLLVGPR